MFDFLRNLFGGRRSNEDAAAFLRAAGDATPEREVEVSIIRACRENFGEAPRPVAPEDRIAMAPEMYRAYAVSGDEMLRIFRDEGILLSRGRVVWGQLVQANQTLFHPDNRETYPAGAIYSLDPFFDGRLSLLTSMARGLFAQKGSRKADREIKPFVDVVTDEMARVLRRPMPHSYTGGRDVNFATCFIPPSHLPFGYLCRPSFPIVVAPEETEAMMLLPSRYWPTELVEHWRD